MISTEMLNDWADYLALLEVGVQDRPGIVHCDSCDVRQYLGAGEPYVCWFCQRGDDLRPVYGSSSS